MDKIFQTNIVFKNQAYDKSRKCFTKFKIPLSMLSSAAYWIHVSNLHLSLISASFNQIESFFIIS